MPAKDLYHELVKTALENEGWMITHDPYHIDLGFVDFYIDLGEERLIAAERNHDKIAWEEDIQVHGCLAHLQIIGDKIWIYRDGIEDGIANELVSAEIPKDRIVLGFHPPEVRQYTDFAVN